MTRIFSRKTNKALLLKESLTRDLVSFSESGGLLELSGDGHDSTHHDKEVSLRDTVSVRVDPVAESEGVFSRLGARVRKVSTCGRHVIERSDVCAKLCLVDQAGLTGANFSPSGGHSNLLLRHESLIRSSPLGEIGDTCSLLLLGGVFLPVVETISGVGADFGHEFSGDLVCHRAMFLVMKDLYVN